MKVCAYGAISVELRIVSEVGQRAALLSARRAQPKREPDEPFCEQESVLTGISN